MGMMLSKLLASIGLSIENDLCITGMSQDSRTISPGDLFCLRSVAQTDVTAFVEEAKSRGAAVILHDETLSLPACGLPQFKTDHLIKKLGYLANVFYGTPSQYFPLIGVTGTNGKSSICHFVAQILLHLNKKVGVLGTIGQGLFPNLSPSPLTSIEPVSLQKMLYEMALKKVDAVVMEASSHALTQYRVAGSHFHTVVFTNLTRDHLDYHGTMQAYFEAKAKLFLEYNPKHSVINLYDAYGRQLWNLLSPSQKKGAYVLADKPEKSANGYFVIVKKELTLDHMQVHLQSHLGDFIWQTPLCGEFNVLNSLEALLVVLSLGVPFSAAGCLGKVLKAPPGRLQTWRSAKGGLIVVDYAHTPDALSAALQAIRPYIAGRLLCVFGCGGDRDRGKRPLMLRAAVAQADEVILTQDNPRSESPMEIISDMMHGFSNDKPLQVVLDRQEAVHLALSQLGEHDGVLIAGKGHENVQWIGQEAVVFSDIETVENYLKE